MRVLLAGDIGGTKTILRLVQQQSNGSLVTLEEMRYRSSDFDSLAPMVNCFLGDVGEKLRIDPQPQRACFAIAGPVVDQTAKLTNLSWRLSARQLEQDLAIAHVALINDFGAVGYGVLGLSGEDLYPLQQVEPQAQAPIAVIGAGTGLGESFLIWQQGRYKVFSSEGGHADFAPRTELECQLLLYLRERHMRVSVERVVSGQGIVAIYQWLRDAGHGSADTAIGAAVLAWEQGESGATDPAALIADGALTHSDPLAEQTLHYFVSFYGAETGNLALKVLPYGGIFIAGGIAPKILPLLQQETFLHSFLAKGRMRSLLEQMPVYVVLNQAVGLIGAALYAATL
jgi:glucokinase